MSEYRTCILSMNCLKYRANYVPPNYERCRCACQTSWCIVPEDSFFIVTAAHTLNLVCFITSLILKTLHFAYTVCDVR